MTPGLAAHAIIFVAALAGLAIVAPLWLAYASHCFLVVLTESTVGNPEVNWPDETVADWWWKPIYTFGVLAVWTTFGGVLFSPLILAGPWPYALAVATFVWFGYPIGLFCVMDSRNSPASQLPMVLHLLRHPGLVLLVGVMTLPLGVAVGAAGIAMLRYSSWWMIATVIVLPLALLLYARAWGRLGWLVLNATRRQQQPKETPPAEAKQTTVLDPWAMPPAEEVPEMDVEVEEEPEPPTEDDGDEEWAKNPKAYGVPAAVEHAPVPFSHEEYYDEYRKRAAEREARAEGRPLAVKRRRKRATLANAFGSDFWYFLGEAHTQRAGVSLAVLTLAFLGLVQVAVVMWPGG